MCVLTWGNIDILVEVREQLCELILSFHIHGSSKVQAQVVRLYMASGSPTEPSQQPPVQFLILAQFLISVTPLPFFKIVSLCGLVCPRTLSVDQAVLELTVLPFSISWVLGLKGCTITPCPINSRHLNYWLLGRLGVMFSWISSLDCTYHSDYLQLPLVVLILCFDSTRLLQNGVPE